MRGIIVHPKPFLGPGPDPSDRMANELLGLNVSLTPLNGVQSAMFGEHFVVDANDILNGLHSRSENDKDLHHTFLFWHRRYFAGAVKIFRVPRGAVQIVQ